MIRMKFQNIVGSRKKDPRKIKETIHPLKNPYHIKRTLVQVFSCEFCKISKNNFFDKTLPATVSVYVILYYLIKIQIKYSHSETPWKTNGTQKSTKRKRRLYKKLLKRCTIENKSNYAEAHVRRCSLK